MASLGTDRGAVRLPFAPEELNMNLPKMLSSAVLPAPFALANSGCTAEVSVAVDDDEGAERSKRGNHGVLSGDNTDRGSLCDGQIAT
jgi:hypothetical protein